MSELIKNPRVMEKAQKEVRQVFNDLGTIPDETSLHDLKFLNLIIKETLRLHPPIPLIPRECRKRCHVNGYDIHVKGKVLINAWAIGRDPSFWNEPERFINVSTSNSSHSVPEIRGWGDDRTEKPTPTHCVRNQSNQNQREFPCPTFPPLFQQKTPFLLPYSTKYTTREHHQHPIPAKNNNQRPCH
ncbi:hypothetical protein Peur_023519 [Populus x canadensis]